MRKFLFVLGLVASLTSCQKEDDNFEFDTLETSAFVDVNEFAAGFGEVVKSSSATGKSLTSNDAYFNWAISQDADTKAAAELYFGTLIANNNVNDMLAHYNDGQAVAEVILNNIDFYVAFADFQTVVTEASQNYDANQDGDLNDSALIMRRSLAIYGDAHNNQIKSANLFLEGWTMVEFFNNTEKAVAGETSKTYTQTQFTAMSHDVPNRWFDTDVEGISKEGEFFKGHEVVITTTVESVLYTDGTIEGTVETTFSEPSYVEGWNMTGNVRGSGAIDIYVGGSLVKSTTYRVENTSSYKILDGIVIDGVELPAEVITVKSLHFTIQSGAGKTAIHWNRQGSAIIGGNIVLNL